MGIIDMLLFSDGGVFSNQCQHTFSTSMSAYYAGKRALGFEYYSVSHPISTNTTELPYSGPSCWSITVHWCGTFAKQHIHLKWNVSSSELWNTFTMMLAPAMKNCLPVPTYQPWNCIVKEKFLWKCSNLLTTFHHIFYGGLVQSKKREL